MLKSYTLRLIVDGYTQSHLSLIETIKNNYETFVHGNVIIFKGNNIVGYLEFREEKRTVSFGRLIYVSDSKRKEIEKRIGLMFKECEVEKYDDNTFIAYSPAFYFDVVTLNLNPNIIINHDKISSLLFRNYEISEYDVTFEYKYHYIHGRICITIESDETIVDGINSIKIFVRKIKPYVFSLSLTPELLRPM